MGTALGHSSGRAAASQEAQLPRLSSSYQLKDRVSLQGCACVMLEKQKLQH